MEVSSRTQHRHSRYKSTSLHLLLLLASSTILCQVTAQQSKSTSTTISGAPPGQLINGIDDVDLSGNCLSEIKQYCSDITAGEGRVADCLSDQITESESVQGDKGASEAPVISDACREEVYQYKIQRNTNVNLNVPLARACKVDAEKFCNQTWMLGYKSGPIIACLRENRDRLAPGCKKEVYKVQMAGAEDFRADAQLFEACSKDAEKLCVGVKAGGGRIQACLRDQPASLSPQCMDQLYRQEAENADDVRLSVRLYAKCMADKRKFCRDVAPGAARVKECLEEHRNQPGFSTPCKDEIDAMIERRARDFRLDARLKETCADDIHHICDSFYGDSTFGPQQEAGHITKCLQDYKQEIRSEACKQMVHKYQELAAQDIRFNIPLAQACYKDRQSFCAGVPPGSARVMWCLNHMRDQLSTECRAALFDEEVGFSENIDFQYPMRKACAKELQLFCADVPHGEARTIRCLQDHKYQKDFSKECREEVRQYEVEASSDYRFNYKLLKACKEDVNSLCALACDADQGKVCGGKVLRCLTDKRDRIKSEACKHEVFYFEKMEVTDYRNDVILAAACQEDVTRFCKDVEPGEGRVHECLRSHRTKLSDKCRQEELLLEELEAENVELKPGVMRICKDERHMFCKGVIPGAARMFRCLAEKMGDLDFGEACRAEITAKLQRRQANWKLDPPLRKACKESVATYCSVEDAQHQERALVYKCLIRVYEDLDASCQKELGRAMHMAFFIWQPEQLLTQDCDEDIRVNCLAYRPNMDKTPGAVGQCLSTIVDDMSGEGTTTSTSSSNPLASRQLSNECKAIAEIAQPPDLKKAFEASLTMVVVQSQLQMMQGVTGLEMIRTDRYGNAKGITLTGWTALAGIAAFLIIIIWGAGFAWNKYWGINTRASTLVFKNRHR